MNNLYVRLAAQNIKKHRRSYVPFMLAGVFVAAVSYILNSLSNNTELGPTSQMMFTLGSTVVMLFAVIFLFYTNSFLMKQRKKELGLYNVLGMNKGHIARVIGLETLFTALIVIVGGCAVGILLDKLTFLIVAKMIRITPNYGFHIIPKSLQYVAVVFGVIYVLILHLECVSCAHFASHRPSARHERRRARAEDESVYGHSRRAVPRLRLCAFHSVFP